MTALSAARQYLAMGIPVPLDVAFDLIAQCVDPDGLTSMPTWGPL